MSYEESRQKALEDGLLPTIDDERAKEFSKRGWRYDVVFQPAQFWRERYDYEIPEGAMVLDGSTRPEGPEWLPESKRNLNIDIDEVFPKRQYVAKEPNLPYEIEEHSVFDQDEPYIHLLDEE